MHILDTDVISNLRRRTPYRGLLDFLSPIPTSAQFVTTTTVTELSFGVQKAMLENPATGIAVKAWLRGFLATANVLPFERQAAEILGAMQALRTLRNSPVTPANSYKLRVGGDLAIASVAFQHDAIVVTRNFDDFRLIARHYPDLKVFDPFTRQTLPEP